MNLQAVAFLSFIAFSSTLLGDNAIIFATNDGLAGTVDANLLGQSFTISGPVELTSVDVYVQRESGGSAFQLYLQPFDPWTNTRGNPLASVAVALSEIPDSAAGGWVSVSIDPPVAIATPGIYGIFLDTDSNGFPNGYNNYGYSNGDSVVGGRIVGPIFSKPVEMMMRLHGVANSTAFSSSPIPTPKISAPVVDKMYSAVAGRMLTYFTFSWNTQVGAVYVVESTKNFTQWFASSYLGNGDSMSRTINNEYWATQFIRVTAIPLGDYRK